MFKTFFAALAFSFLTLHAQAFESSTAAVIHDNGDLWIRIADKPAKPPYEAATVWNAILGNTMNKVVATNSFSLKCNTLLSEPQRIRYGTCVFRVKATKVKAMQDGYGVLITGPEAKILLAKFAGGQSMDLAAAKNLRLADGNLLITADHKGNMFALLAKTVLFGE